MILNEESYPAVLSMAQKETFAMIVLDNQANILRANKKVYKMFGYHTPGALKGFALLSLFNERFRSNSYKKLLLDYLVSGDISIDSKKDILMGLRHNGTSFPIEMTLAPIKAGSEKKQSLCLAIIKPFSATSQSVTAATQQLKQLTKLKSTIQKISTQLDEPLSSVTDILDKVEDRIPADKLDVLKEQIRKLQVIAGDITPAKENVKTISLNKQLMLWVNQFLIGQFSISWKLTSKKLNLLHNDSIEQIFELLFNYLSSIYSEAPGPKKIKILTIKSGNLCEMFISHNGKQIPIDTQNIVFDPNTTHTYQGDNVLEKLKKATRKLYLQNGSIKITEQTKEIETINITLPTTASEN